MRFHSELRISAPVEVRSARLTDAGALDGAIVHLLLSGDRLAATALDMPIGDADLPEIAASDVPFALPRGIQDSPPQTPTSGADMTEVELGPIRSEDIDHAGHLRFDTILRFSSNIQHIQLNKLGLTPEFADTHNINRMGVEFRVSPCATPPLGTPLQGRTWLWKIAGKALWAMTEITTPDRSSVAAIEMCVVTVDLKTRKAVAVPDFMYTALGGEHRGTT